MKDLTLLWLITLSSCCFGMKEEKRPLIKKDVIVITGNDNQETVISPTIANQIPVIYSHFSDYPSDESLIYQIPYAKAPTIKKIVDLLTQYQQQGVDPIDPHMQELVDNVEIARKNFNLVYTLDTYQEGPFKNALIASGLSQALMAQVKYREEIDETLPKKSFFENECGKFSFSQMIDIIGTADFLGIDSLVNPLINIACLKKITANDVLNSEIKCPQELLIPLYRRAFKPSVTETIPVRAGKIVFNQDGSLLGIQDYRPGWLYTIIPTAQIWDTKRRKIVKTINHVTNIAFDGEGKYLACDIQPSFGNGPVGRYGNENNDVIEIYDTHTWLLKKKSPLRPSKFEEEHFEPCVLYGNDAGYINFLNLYCFKKEGRRIGWIDLLYAYEPTRAAFRKDRAIDFNEKKGLLGVIQKKCSSALMVPHAVFIWDTKKNVCIKSLSIEVKSQGKFKIPELDSCSFSSRGDLFAVCGNIGQAKGILKIWDTSTWACLHTIIDRDSTSLASIVFNPNGRSIATVAHTTDKSSVKLWGPLYDHELGLQQLAFCIHYVENNGKLTSELKPFYDDSIPENIKKTLGTPQWMNIKFTRPFKPLQSPNSVNKRSEASKVLLGSKTSSQALEKIIENRNTLGQKSLRLIKLKN